MSHGPWQKAVALSCSTQSKPLAKFTACQANAEVEFTIKSVLIRLIMTNFSSSALANCRNLLKSEILQETGAQALELLDEVPIHIQRLAAVIPKQELASWEADSSKLAVAICTVLLPLPHAVGLICRWFVLAVGIAKYKPSYPKTLVDSLKGSLSGQIAARSLNSLASKIPRFILERRVRCLV